VFLCVRMCFLSKSTLRRLHTTTVMDEETIIKERVLKSEIAFKRLQRLCEVLTNGIPEKGTLPTIRTQLEAEFESFDTRLTKMKLEVQMSRREIQRYQEQKDQSIADIERLNLKSQELQDRLAQVQFIRSQKEECNTMVEEMTKAKRVMVPDPLGSGQMVPIIGLLNASRAEDTKLNESLREEIASLEYQRDSLQAQWNSKKQQVVGLMEFVERFNEDIIKKEEVFTAESERRRNDEADEGGDVEIDGEDESEREELEKEGEREDQTEGSNREEQRDKDGVEEDDMDDNEQEYGSEGSETREGTPSADVEMADAENI
jgi:hypothetical protein